MFDLLKYGFLVMQPKYYKSAIKLITKTINNSEIYKHICFIG